MSKDEKDIYHCSKEKEIYHIRSWFQQRPYLNKVLHKKLVKIKFSNQEKTCSKKGKSIPFVVTYHPILQNFDDIIKRNLNHRLMVSFRGARKLISYLVREKVSPLECKVGFCGCGKTTVSGLL